MYENWQKKNKNFNLITIKWNKEITKTKWHALKAFGSLITTSKWTKDEIYI